MGGGHGICVKYGLVIATYSNISAWCYEGVYHDKYLHAITLHVSRVDAGSGVTPLDICINKKSCTDACLYTQGSSLLFAPP